MKSQKIRLWIEASRPKTLAAAFIPVLIGCALAWRDGQLSWLSSSVALACAFLIQVGTNFANDYFDFVKGSDTEERIGFRRATAAGLISPRQMLTATTLTMGFAFLLGLYLVWVGGTVVLIIGILSLIFGILYTGGPYPLGYNGLGDIFVFIFFGIVAVMTTYYINTLEWSEHSFWASLAVGALCVNILVVNNLRDVEQDKKSGKRTLGVLFGENMLKWEYMFMILTAYAIPLFFHLQFNYNGWTLLPFLISPWAVILIKTVFTETNKSNLNITLERTAQFMMFFGILFSVGITLN
ncbi:MAG: 1,4-dihydroxy-2-naphthoate polyprenyltransferase [Balneolaceae bacterium]|nr:1,4-dihydroxy-2-naphthoate polyprenyltransferase [Balneolaceae bacterium]